MWKDRPAGELVELALKEANRAATIGYGRTAVSREGQSVRQLDLDQAAANLRLAILQGFKDLRILRSRPESTDLLFRQDVAPFLMDLAFPLWPFAAGR